jgi:hypothetical protein
MDPDRAATQSAVGPDEEEHGGSARVSTVTGSDSGSVLPPEAG